MHKNNKKDIINNIDVINYKLNDPNIYQHLIYNKKGIIKNLDIITYKANDPKVFQKFLYEEKKTELIDLLTNIKKTDILYKEIKKRKRETKIYYYNFTSLEDSLYKNTFFLNRFNYYYSNYLDNKLYINKYNSIITLFGKENNKTLYYSKFNYDLFLKTVNFINNNNIISSNKKLFQEESNIQFILDKDYFLNFYNKKFFFDFDLLEKVEDYNRYSKGDIIIKKYKEINFLKKCIKILSGLLIENGNYSRIYRIVSLTFYKIRLKDLDIYNFFKEILFKLHIPISLYSKKIAGRKVMVPNPYNYNYMKKSIGYSFRIIKKSLKVRREIYLKDRLFFELMDIYENKGLSIKKVSDLIKTIEESTINMRFMRKKKGRR